MPLSEEQLETKNTLKRILNNLTAWCRSNFILANLPRVELKEAYKEEEQIIDFPGWAKAYLLLPVENKLFDSEMMFLFEGFEQEGLELMVEAKKFEYFVFEFGKQFYYCKPVLKKDTFNEQRFSVDFADLKYLGTNTKEFDVNYNPLGIHTEYDILNGNGLKNYIKKAKFFGCTHVGMCDRNTMAGVLAWQVEAQKQGLKSIIGETVDVAVGYDPNDQNLPTTYQLKLYVTNWQGWQNLLWVNKCLNIDYKKFIPEEELCNHQEGLVCVLGAESYLNFNDKKEIAKWLGKFRKFQNLYFQVDCSEFFAGGDDLRRLQVIQDYLAGGWQTKIPPILIQDIYYCDQEQYIVRDYLNKVAKRGYDYSEDHYFKCFDEINAQMMPLFKDEQSYLELISSMLENLAQMCDECDGFEIETGKRKFPIYEFAPDGMTNEEYFQHLIAQGFQEKVIDAGRDVEAYWERVQKEIPVIEEGNLIDYLLIVLDPINWCKANDIFVGPGRGSVVGCAVAWMMGLTSFPPIEYGLLFERFLDSTRTRPNMFYEVELEGKKRTIPQKEYEEKYKGLPILKEVKKYNPDSADIDSDYESAYREAVKNYIKQRFGEYNTCSIGSYTRLKLRACIKDFSSVKGFKFSFVNFITGKMDNQLEYTFRDFIEYAAKDKDIYAFVQDNPELVHAVKYAMGQPKARSIHASGVLILPKHDEEGRETNVFNSLPVHEIDGMLVSEVEGKYTDLMGFLKNDILSLDQLDKFKNTLNLIAESNNYKRDYYKLYKKNGELAFDLDTIPLTDRATFKLFQKGYNEDVFQFNSNGLKNYSKKVKPDCFEDLIAMNALWRPATMSANAHMDFALMKHGKKEAQYDYGLEEVTKNTFGLIIYQETMMQAVVALGNFTLLEANKMRTATKKFDKVVMGGFKDKFIKGAIENKCPPAEAERIWNKIMAFSSYTFNKSHSAVYAKIAYQTQWLKVHYPLEFWTTAIQFNKEEIIPFLISEMSKIDNGISIKPPSINKSEIDFKCDPPTNSIYWSLAKIKGLGVKTVEAVMQARKKPFTSLSNFMQSVTSKVNKGHIEKMIMVGCFDELEGVHRPGQRLNVLKKYAELRKYQLPATFSGEEVSRDYWWTLLQKRMTGFGDIDFRQLINKNPQTTKHSKLLALPDVFFAKKEYDEVLVCGVVTDLFERQTKKKDTFIIMTLTCNNEMIKVLIWDSIIADHVEFLEKCEGKVIALTGKVRYDNYNGLNSVHCTDETKFYYL